MFLRNKSTLLTLNCPFWPKYISIIHNNTSSGEKVHLCCPLTTKSGVWSEKKNGAWSVHISLLIQMRQLFPWRKHYYGQRNHILAGSNDLKLKTYHVLLHKVLTDGLAWCGLLVDYCDVFIICLDSHSDGTHSLQRIHWWAGDVMPHFSTQVHILSTFLSTNVLICCHLGSNMTMWFAWRTSMKVGRITTWSCSCKH